jgi:hypothetical protein
VSARIALPQPMMPCSKFLFLATIFPKNVGYFSRHKPVKLLGPKKFSGQIPVDTLIFRPISVKFRSINSIQFPLKAL